MIRFATFFLVVALAVPFATAQSGDTSRVTWQPSYSGSCQDCLLIRQHMPFWDLSGGFYNGANFSYSTLQGAHAKGALFTGITASHTDFSRADLSNANFADATLDHARLIGVMASGADFSGAVLDRCDAREAKFIGVNMTGASAVHMLGFGTDFSAAIATGAVFDHATLRGAIFDGALLSNTSFVEADVAGASFRGSRFHGANLARMIGYAEADFTDACRSASTLLPPELSLPLCPDAGFRPPQSEAP